VFVFACAIELAIKVPPATVIPLMNSRREAVIRFGGVSLSFMCIHSYHLGLADLISTAAIVGNEAVSSRHLYVRQIALIQRGVGFDDFIFLQEISNE